MMKSQLPKWSSRLFKWFCSDNHYEELQGDLEEKFERNVKEFGLRKAQRLYSREVLQMIRPSVIRTDLKKMSINPYVWHSYIVSAFRNMRKHALYSTLNVLGLSLSLSVGLLLISIIYDQISFDRFHNDLNRLYRITTYSQYLDYPLEHLATTSMPLLEEVDKLNAVEETARIRRVFYGDVENSAKIIPLRGHFTDPGFLKIFNFPLIAGSKLNALKDPFSVVLTESSAQKLYGEQSPIGDIVKIDPYGDFKITGVVKDPPRNSHIQFEMLGSFSSVTSLERDQVIAPMLSSWDNVTSGYIYLKLNSESHSNDLQAVLDNVGAQVSADISDRNVSYELQKVGSITPGKDMINQIGPTMESILLYAASGLFLVVLLSALFNYSSLSLARGISRAREVGIRKVMGSSRKQIFWQFVTEAVIISLFSLVLGILLLQLIKPEFYKIDKDLQQFVFLNTDGYLIILFILFAVIIGLIAGTLPSMFLSGLQTSQVLKGTENLRAFRFIPFRKGLLVFQFTLSLFFIIFSIQVTKQYNYATGFDLGFRQENIVNIPLQGNDPELVKARFIELANVDGVSFSSAVLSTGLRNNGWMKLGDVADSTMIEFAMVSPEYPELHQIDLLHGRNIGSSGDEALVNEKLLEQLGLDPDHAIGQEISIGNVGKFIITGVMEDFHYAKIKQAIGGFVLLNADQYYYANVSLTHSDENTISELEKAWERVDEKVHSFEGEFYSDRIDESYAFFKIMARVIGFFSLLAISIAVMGMLGMAIYSSEVKMKEISIRKVLGATSGNLFSFLSRDYAYILVASCLIASTLIFLLFSQILLPEMEQKAPLEFTDFLLGCSIILLLTASVISSQLLKVLKSNPGETLKSE